MAEILLARTRKPAKPERLVVIKRMHRQLAADREYVQMFLDEARIATTLRHPNIVEVFESGEDNDQYYIAMEHLHGHDLRRVLSQMATQRVPMRLGQALAIARGMCRGLEYTHERTDADGKLLGIVHRDVSPHNVLLTYNGRVKLVDFGIAKASTQIAKTRTGILKGKVAYMSPEQAMGDVLDRRSDVFCIGILLWEMTTGQWLYRRKSELETLKAVVESDAPRPSLVSPSYPPELEEIVMKTLARERGQRWATAGELDEALTEFAKRRRLDLAPSTLAVLMSTAFSEEVAAWQDARRAGISLGDHLVAELDREEDTRPPRDPIAHDEFGDPELEDLPTTVVAATPRPTPVRAATPIPAQTAPVPSRLQRMWPVAAAVASLSAIGFVAGVLLSHEPAPPPPAPPPPVVTPPVPAPKIVAPPGPTHAPPVIAPARPTTPGPTTVTPAPPPPSAGRPKATAVPPSSDASSVVIAYPPGTTPPPPKKPRQKPAKPKDAAAAKPGDPPKPDATPKSDEVVAPKPEGASATKPAEPTSGTPVMRD